MQVLTSTNVVPHTELIPSINKNALKESLPLTIRLLNQEDITQIIQLRRKVFVSLKGQDCYVWEEKENEFLSQHCGKIGETFGIFSRRTLIAYAILGYHTMLEQEDLSSKIRFPLNENERGKSSQLVSCMVAPGFQGIGLHKLLIRKRLALSLARGYRHCLASASPSNYWSRKNLFSAGFYIHWMGMLPNPLAYYYLLHCNLEGPLFIPNPDLSEAVLSVDREKQIQLLEQGYFGYKNKIDASDKQSILFFHPHSLL